jgi:hypothetical protein
MEVKLIHFIKDVYQYFESVPTSTWYTIGLVALSSPIVSSVVEILKRKWKLTEEKYGAKAEKYVVGVLGLISLASSYLVNFIQYGTSNPHFLGDLTPQIMAGSVLAYHLIKNPVFGRVYNWLAVETEFSKQLAANKSVEGGSVTTATPTAETDTSKDSLFS